MDGGDVPEGWTPASWRRRLLDLASLCERLRPDLAADYRAWAERIEVADSPRPPPARGAAAAVCGDERSQRTRIMRRWQRMQSGATDAIRCKGRNQMKAGAIRCKRMQSDAGPRSE